MSVRKLAHKTESEFMKKNYLEVFWSKGDNIILEPHSRPLSLWYKEKS